MSNEPHPTVRGRFLAILAVASLVGFALWAGVYVPRQRGRVRQPGDASPDLRTEAAGQALRIVEGPEMLRENGRTQIRWKTSAPADSLLTCGRHDASEHVLAKDSQLVTEHRFEVPPLASVELHRFFVMSIDERGNAATARLEPGGGER